MSFTVIDCCWGCGQSLEELVVYAAFGGVGAFVVACAVVLCRDGVLWD